MLPKKTVIEIYTDGSTRKNGQANGGQGAWGFIAVVNNQIIQESAEQIYNTTNQQCEMRAVLEACKWANENYPNNAKIIYSDSAYVINCYKDKWYTKWINNGWIGSNKQPVKNREFWEKLIPYFDNMLFTFNKVKGHADNEYNNEIDNLVQYMTLKMVNK